MKRLFSWLNDWINGCLNCLWINSLISLIIQFFVYVFVYVSSLSFCQVKIVRAYWSKDISREIKTRWCWLIINCSTLWVAFLADSKFAA